MARLGGAAPPLYLNSTGVGLRSEECYVKTLFLDWSGANISSSDTLMASVFNFVAKALEIFRSSSVISKVLFVFDLQIVNY